MSDDTRTTLSFDDVYESHVDALWRCARAMGIAEHAVSDVMQEVFVVVHRRLHELDHGEGIRTWLTRILLRVVQQQRRTFRRKNDHDELSDNVADFKGPDAHENLERYEASRVLAEILDALDEDRRVVFVLAEFEQLTVPEVAKALGVNVNTVYSRLRLARRDYEKHLARIQARQPRRKP